MMTAIRYPWCSVRMRLIENVSTIYVEGTPLRSRTHFRSVDFPAPRNPEMMVRGTWWSEEDGGSSLPTISLSSSGSIRVLCVISDSPTLSGKRCARRGGNDRGVFAVHHYDLGEPLETVGTRSTQ